MLQNLQNILPKSLPFDWAGSWDEDWRPVSRYGLIGWLLFYLIFLAYAFSKHGEFLFIDLANLVVHEGGHLLFGWFGSTLGLWGGTLLQWLVPLLLGIIGTWARAVQAAGGYPAAGPHELAQLGKDLSE